MPWWPFGVIGVAVVVASLSFVHRPRDAERTVEAAQQLRHGRVPLWDSRHGFGEALLAKGKLAAFTPTIVPLFIPSRAAWPARDALRMILAGIAAGLIVSRRGGTDRRAFIFAACYAAATGILGHVYDPAAEIWCWQAWCVFAIDLVIARPSSLRVALAVIPFALAFGVGDWIFAAAVIVVCVGFAMGASLARGKFLPMPAVIVALLVAFGISGVVWWPIWNERGVGANSSSVRAPAKVWFADRMQWAANRAEARKQAAEEKFDPKKVVLIDDEAGPEWEEGIKILKENPNAIRSLKAMKIQLGLSDETPGHWRLDMPKATGWVVIAQAYDRGWSARVVGKGWPLRESHDKIVLPGDGGLIAIPVRQEESGDAELQIDYRPASWRQGVVISAASGAVLVLLIGFSLLVGVGELPREKSIICRDAGPVGGFPVIQGAQ